MRRRQTLAILAVASALACLGLGQAGGAAAAGPAPPRAHVSIIGGRTASIGELPWLAFIEGRTGRSGYSCTGTVVAPRLILTAGHCVENIESGEVTAPADLLVATGVADLNTVAAGNVSRVLQALVYPRFDPGQLRGDAGLLVLTAPVSAPPIQLGEAGDAGLREPGTPLRIAGWGLSNSRAKEISGQLRMARTKVEPVSSCRARSQRYYPFYSPAQQLCAIDPPRFTVSACHGDSGGPAIATRADGTPVEIGIVSTGGPGCNTRLPNVFTRTDRIASWVSRWIAAIEAGGPRPAVRVPKVRTPTLTVPIAKELAAVGFAQDFKRRYTRAVEQRYRCGSVARTRVRCHVTWRQGGDSFFGDAAVFYRVVKNTVTWGFSYDISWVDSHCYFDSGHRGRCRIQTKSR
ncbi:MAG: S1 family peptidase [Syntrophothermus sp.]